MDSKEHNQEVKPTSNTKTTATPVATPQEVATLKGELSHKNQDYVYRLVKFLEAGGMSAPAIEQTLAELLPDMLSAQRQGHPATKVYGAPSVKADQLLHVPAKPKTLTFWMRAVDNGSLYFSLFAVLYGILGMFTSSKANPQAGILTMLVMGAGFGVAMTWFNDTMLKKRAEQASKKNLFLSLVLVTLAVMIVMFAIIALAGVIPGVVNVVLPPVMDLILAALAFGGRYLFRKHYGIKGSTLSV